MRKPVTYVVTMVLLFCMTLSGCVFDSPEPTEPEETWPKEISVDWAMHGAWMVMEGTYRESVDMTIRGTITDNKEGDDKLAIAVTMPERFRYRLDVIPIDFNCLNQPYKDVPHLFVAHVYGYDKRANEGDFCTFALCAQTRRAIFLFEKMPQYCLVVSADPGDDPQEILEYFLDFISIYQNY